MADIIICLIIIIISVFLYAQTFSYSVVPGYERMGPEVWPRFLFIGIVFVSLIIIIISIMDRKKGASLKDEPQKKWNTPHVIICCAGLFAINLLIPYLGFLLATFFGVMGLIFILGERNKVVIPLYAFASVFIIYLFFVKILLVPIPRGVSIFQEMSYYLY